MSYRALNAADRLIAELCEARGADEVLPLAERLAAVSRAESNDERPLEGGAY